MVAVIKTGHAVRSILNYNENKVKQGCARCIGEGNYPLDAERLSYEMKLSRLLRQNALNENVKRNSVHISLNFDPTERYTEQKLMEIARTYMDKIGFGRQPYLVYEHHDAGHPHIHLVSIKVRDDGSRIDMQNIGRNQSERARKEIEIAFGLIRAEGRGRTFPLAEPVPVQRLVYGKMQSKKAIAGVLQSVLGSYKYTSLAELNAVLGLYGIRADRGSESSRIFKTRGLVYRILDQDGKQVGVPIKASDFYFRPTLAFLERRFVSNGSLALEKKRIRNAVDLGFLKGRPGLSQLVLLLKKQGIDMVLRSSSKQLLYGITYVDHTTRCVCNGSALGKNYSAKGIVERCMAPLETASGITAPCKSNSRRDGLDAGDSNGYQVAGQYRKREQENTDHQIIADTRWEILSRAEWQPDFVPRELKGRRRKKKRKGPPGPH